MIIRIVFSKLRVIDLQIIKILYNKDCFEKKINCKKFQKFQENSKLWNSFSTNLYKIICRTKMYGHRQNLVELYNFTWNLINIRVHPKWRWHWYRFMSSWALESSTILQHLLSYWLLASLFRAETLLWTCTSKLSPQSVHLLDCSTECCLYSLCVQRYQQTQVMREQRNYMFARTGFIHSHPRIDRRPSKLIKLDSFIEHAISPFRNGFCHCLFSEFNCFIAFENHFSTWTGVVFFGGGHQAVKSTMSDTCLRPGWLHGATFHIPHSRSLFCNFPRNFSPARSSSFWRMTVGGITQFSFDSQFPGWIRKGCWSMSGTKVAPVLKVAANNRWGFSTELQHFQPPQLSHLISESTIHSRIAWLALNIHTSQWNAFHLLCRYVVVVLRQYTLDADTSSMLNQQLLPLAAGCSGDTFTVACKIFVQGCRGMRARVFRATVSEEDSGLPGMARARGHGGVNGDLIYYYLGNIDSMKHCCRTIM